MKLMRTEIISPMLLAIDPIITSLMDVGTPGTGACTDVLPVDTGGTRCQLFQKVLDGFSNTFYPCNFSYFEHQGDRHHRPLGQVYA